MAQGYCVWPTECVLGNLNIFFYAFSLKRTTFKVCFSGKEFIFVGSYEGHFELSVLS